ncbi:MAG: condensation domain-containing protein, partial [Acidobacteriota bacterium]
MKHFSIDAELARGVKKLSEQNGATVYMTLLAAFMALLSRYSGERDIVVGSPIANRNLSDVESLIGFFVNTLLMRTQVTREITFQELLAKVRQAALEAYAHQDLPFERLVAELQPERSLSYSALFQVMFIMQNAPMGKLEMAGLRETTLQMDVNVVRCDLTLSMEESGDVLKGLLTYKSELFDASTIERFSQRYQRLLRSVVASPDALLADLETDEPIAPPPLPSVGDGRVAEPLSYHQERMWFIDRFETGTVYPSSPVYHNLPLILHLEGAVDVALLERSINLVISRHEVLRTRIGSDDDRAFQTIVAQSHLKLDVEPLKRIETLDEGVRAAIAEVERPFRLEGDPPLRAKLFSISRSESILVLTIHHILADEESLGVIATEVGAAYTDLINSRSPAAANVPVQYSQVASGERQLSKESFESLLMYWRTQLQGRLQPLELPVDRPRPPVHTYTAGRQTLTIDSDLSARLSSLSERGKTSVDGVLLAAFKVVLHRYACQGEIVVGVSDTGRKRNELRGTVGPIANLLALRSDLGGNPSFGAVLERVTRTCEQGSRHRSLPFDLLVRELNPEKDMSRTALFDVLFQFREKDSAATLAFGSATAKVIRTNLGHGKYDLNLGLYETVDGIEGTLVYNRDFFDAFSIEQLVRHFKIVLNAVADDSSIPVDDIILLNKAEEKQQVSEWNNTAASYPTDRTIHELFAEQVARSPQATAVTCGGESISYRELDTRANQLAHFLKSRGVVRQTLVALCLERSIEMIVSMLGVLKAGAAYLPLDPSHPPDRLRFMIEDSGVEHLVSTAAIAKTMPGFEGEMVLLDEASNEIAGMPASEPHSDGTTHDLAYCIYTSGSTGRPKGVLIEHENVVRLLINDRLPFTFGSGD